MWLQKSRVRWLREGDRNYAFFHKKCKARESHNSLEHLQFHGATLEDPESTKTLIFSHFKSFFMKGQRCKASLNCHNLAKLSVAQRNSLEVEFSLAEIWEGVKSCDGNRAPGPDGYNMQFCKQFWHLVCLKGV